MSQDGLLGIKKLSLPKSCALEAIRWMQLAGRREVEGVALWAGVRDGEMFRVQRTIIPKQEAGSVEQGLLYVVGREELRRISLELFQTNLELVAQIHSHPRAAYHSDTDDAYPIVTVVGGVSVVVPNFAKGGLNLSEWAIYRLLPGYGWTALRRTQNKSFIELVDDLPAQEAPSRRRFWFWPWL